MIRHEGYYAYDTEEVADQEEADLINLMYHETVELHPTYQMIQDAKKAYAAKDYKTAWAKWCEIYEWFEARLVEGADNHEVFEKQNEMMRLFTNDEVYAITDYGKGRIYA